MSIGGGENFPMLTYGDRVLSQSDGHSGLDIGGLSPATIWREMHRLFRERHYRAIPRLYAEYLEARKKK